MVGSNFKSVIATAKFVCVRAKIFEIVLEKLVLLWYCNVCFTICRVFFGAFFNSAFGFVDSRRFAIPATEGNKICFESFSNFGNTRNGVEIRLDFLRNLW